MPPLQAIENPEPLVSNGMLGTNTCEMLQSAIDCQLTSAPKRNAYTPPVLPAPSSSPTYHSSPLHPRIVGPMPNIAMTQFDNNAGAAFFPNFVIQPYSHVSALENPTRINVGQQVKCDSLPPTSMPAVPIHNAPCYQYQSGGPNQPLFQQSSHIHQHLKPVRPQPQAFTINAKTPIIPRQQQLRNLVHASKQLNIVVEGDGQPFPPHETSLPPQHSSIVMSKASASDHGSTQQASVLDVDMFPDFAVPASATVEHKRPRRMSRKADILCKPTLLPKDSRVSQRQHRPPRPVSLVAYDSNDDADGETDDDRSSGLRRVVLTHAQQSPQKQPSGIKLKLKLSNTSEKQSRAQQGSQRRRTFKSNGVRSRAKPKSRPGPKARSEAKKAAEQLLATYPTSIKDKAQPASVKDLLDLVAFETNNYNENPRRLDELKRANEKIKHENNALDHKIKRMQEKSLIDAKSPRSKYDRKAKRKAEEQEFEAEKKSTCTNPRTKSRKTKKMSDQVSSWAGAVFGQPNAPVEKSAFAARNNLVTEHGKSRTASTDSTSSHNFGSSDRDFEPTSGSSPPPIPSLRILKSINGFLQFDRTCSASVNSTYLKDQSQPLLKEDVSNEQILVELLSQKRRKKLEFVPGQMKYLLKRLQSVAMESLQKEQHVKEKGILAETSSVKETEAQVLGASTTSSTSSIAKDTLMAQGLDVNSDMDAEGETDEE